MSKTYSFTKKDQNRYRKTYRYIRKKPKFIYCSSDDFQLVVGSVSFSDSAGPITFTYPTTGPDAVVYSNAPIVTALSIDSESNDAADVNIFVDSISTTAVQFSASAPFIGQVHFQIISQD